MIEDYSIEELTASTTCAGEMDSSFGRRRKLFFWHRYRIMVDNDHAGNSDIHELGPKGTEKQFQL